MDRIERHLFRALLAFVLACALVPAASANDAVVNEIAHAVRKFRADNDAATLEATLRRLAATGSVDANLFLAQFLCTHQNRCDEAVTLLRPFADRGNAEARFVLGRTLLLQKNMEGVAILEAAAAQGHKGAAELLENARRTRQSTEPLTTRNFLIGIKPALYRKLNGFSPEVLRCYKRDAAALVEVNERHYSPCIERVVSQFGNDEEVVKAKGREIAVAFGTCLNRETFQEIGVTVEELMACLPKEKGAEANR